MLYFSNPGHLPIRAATTMGVSVKEGDSPIGMFGTGLKYVIAGVIRLSGTIEIETGGELFTFGKIEEDIRGTPFQIVTMNGVPLGFTTDYGKFWEPWMYVRELWSNCRDENGTHGWTPQPGDTHIRINCTQLERSYAERDTYILENYEPLAITDAGELLNPSEKNVLFYRNIRVAEIPGDCVFSYNVREKLPLTEDRTLSYLWHVTSSMCKIITQLKDWRLIEKAILAGRDTFEGRHLEPFGNPSAEFRAVLKEVFEDKPQRLNESLRRWAQHCWGDNSIKTRPASEFESRKIGKALTLLQALGLQKPFTIKITADPDARVYGFVQNNIVYLTNKCLSEGAGQIATTLVEEYLHVNESLEDYSREFQDRCLNMIVSLAEEHLLGEPL